VTDPNTKKCAVIDSVLVFQYNSATTNLEYVNTILSYIKEQGLTIEWILETHAHADHISGGYHIKSQIGGKVAIGEHITTVQKTFSSIFNLETTFKSDGSQFDHLFKDGDTFQIGSITCQVLHTPGHTPSCVCYLIGDCLFTGDSLFMPDFGTARCDFPGGSARQLYNSITTKIYSLPDETRIFVGHDYPPQGRSIAYETTVGQQKKENVHINLNMNETDFVKIRETRDQGLSAPNLIYPSIQLNINAGKLPEPDTNGIAYLRIPINFLQK